LTLSERQEQDVFRQKKDVEDRSVSQGDIPTHEFYTGRVINAQSEMVDDERDSSTLIDGQMRPSTYSCSSGKQLRSPRCIWILIEDERSVVPRSGIGKRIIHADETMNTRQRK
jgi:hypothetical protein